MQVGLINAQSAYVTPSARALPVQAVRRLEAVAEHDPSTCAHCLAGAVHAFSAGGDEALVSAAAQLRAAQSGLALQDGFPSQNGLPEQNDLPKQDAAPPQETASPQDSHAQPGGLGAGGEPPSSPAAPSKPPTVGLDLAGASEPETTADSEAQPSSASESRQGGPSGAAGQAAAGQELSESELELVRELASRDREVRAHEQAHLAAAGGYASGGPTYTYQTGPDGIRYAIGGEVSIDTSPVPGNPRATLAKAQAIMSAANAPAEPSGQDRAVAAAAAQMAARAQAELIQATAIAAYTKGDTSFEGTESHSF